MKYIFLILTLLIIITINSYGGYSKIEKENSICSNNLIENTQDKLNLDDTIFLKNGLIVIGQIIEISSKQIKYKKNNNSNSPTIVLKTNDVKKITYNDGTTDDFSGKTLNSVYTGAKYEILGVLSLIFGITALFYFGLIFAILSLILGQISLIKIFRRPFKYKGKGFAYAGIILGLLNLFLLFLFVF